MTIGQSIRGVAALLTLGVALLYASFPARADCNADVASLSQKRQAMIEQLNALAKGKQLDPVASCPKLRGLVASEKALFDYLSKNKDWCQVPDAAIENISLSMKKSQNFAMQACNAAVQMKKAQELQAAGGGPGAQARTLPSGPL